MTEFVRVTEAAALLGRSRWWMQQRIREDQLPVYTGTDRRERLLRRSDVERLARPKPVQPRKGGRS